MRPSLRQVLFRSAGLDLNFAGGVFSLNNTRTDSPANIPGWSFSRTDTNGIATALDLAGNVIQFPSRTNLILQSQTFDDAGWTKGGSTVTANATAAPDESITADKLVEDTSTGLHRLSQILAKAASATTYTFTVFAKASERTQLRLALDDVGANNGGATFDLSNGTISTAAAVTGDFTNASASITAVGSWYRLALTVTSNTVTSIRAQTQIAVSGSISYTGVAGSGLFLWGAQLETGSTATAYIPTTTAAVTVVLPRITDRGILVEESRTNLLRWSQDFTISGAGNWQLAGSSTVSGNVAIAPDGSTTADLWSRTTTSASYFTQALTKAASAVTYTYSIYVKKSVGNFFAMRVQGTYPARVDAVFDLSNGTIATAAVTTGSFTGAAATITPSANGFFLVTVTGTSDTTTALQAVGGFLSKNAQVDDTDSAANSAGYIWQADLQVGAFATSPIITTGAAGTRGADVAYVGTLTPLSALTLASDIEVVTTTAAANQYIVSLSDQSVNNRITLFRPSGTTDLTPRITIGGTAYNPSGFLSATTVGQRRTAISVAPSRGMPAANGTLSAGPATPPYTPLYTTLAIGVAEVLSGSLFNGYIRRIRVLPYAATDAQLQSLTAP